MRMINFKIFPAVFFILICFISSVTNAAITVKKPTHHKRIYKGMIDAKSENSWFIGAGVGRSWINLKKSSTTVPNGSFVPPPSDQDTYTIKNPSPQTPAQVNVGYRWHQDKKFLPYYSLFVQYRHYYSTEIKGNIYQYSLPGFENYDYRIKYSADLFSLNGKLNLFEYKRMLPYVSAGIGAIYNSLGSYNESALAGVTARISPDYSNSHSNLALTVGAGIDFKFSKNIWATLGYEFVTQNAVKSGNGVGSWSSTYLNFGRANMNTVFLNIAANIPDSVRS